MLRDTRMPGLVDHGSAVVPSRLDQAHLHLHGSPIDLDWMSEVSVKKCIPVLTARGNISKNSCQCNTASAITIVSECSEQSMQEI